MARKAGRGAKDALGIVLLFVAYFVTARLGLLMDAVAGFATLVWPPTGIALVALFLFGRRLWPGVLAGALCVNLVVGASLPVALAIATGNTLEAVAGSWLLRRVGRFDARLERIRDVVSLVLLGAICSTAISAAVGLFSLLLSGRIGPSMSWPTFRAWWFGDMLGNLVVAPLLFVWASRPALAGRRFLVAEAVVVAGVLVGCSLILFGRPPGEGGVLWLPYVVFPPLLWAALRFAQYGGVTGTFLVSTIAIAGTAIGLGPFVRETLAESLLYLQIFLGLAAVTALTVAAAIAERSRAADARDEFLAIASHELRTPLTALLLHIQAELRSLRGDGPLRGREETIRQLESTERMALRLGKLIGELLEVSRIIWGRFQPEREDVDLAALVQEILARQEQQLLHARCPVQLEVEGAVRGRWDRGRLDRVLDNLIGNAAKYGAGKPIEVRLQGRAENVLLEVRDHGIGIDPADHARVFERFERAVSRKQFGGFGLGLWIVRKIIEAHGGSISLMSVPGAGCTFSVELPRSTSA
jgi:signal transduction histidine kinase